MKTVLWINTLAAVVAVFVTFAIKSDYWETAVFPGQAILAGGLAVLATCVPRVRRGGLLTSSLLLTLLPGTWWFGMEAIPGGDDGTGLAWLFLIGGASLLASASGIAGLIVWLAVTLKRRKRPAQQDV